MTDFKTCMHACMNTSFLFHILESNSFPDIKWCIQYIVAMLFSHKFWLFSRRSTSFGVVCVSHGECKDMQNLMDEICVWMYACKLKIHYKYTPLLSRAYTIFRIYEKMQAHRRNFKIYASCSLVSVCVRVFWETRACSAELAMLFHIRLSHHGVQQWHGRCSRTRNISFHLSNIEQLISFRSFRSIAKPNPKKMQSMNSEWWIRAIWIFEIKTVLWKKMAWIAVTAFFLPCNRNNRFAMVLWLYGYIKFANL